MSVHVIPDVFNEFSEIDKHEPWQMTSGINLVAHEHEWKILFISCHKNHEYSWWIQFYWSTGLR